MLRQFNAVLCEGIGGEAGLNGSLAALRADGGVDDIGAGSQDDEAGQPGREPQQPESTPEQGRWFALRPAGDVL